MAQRVQTVPITTNSASQTSTNIRILRSGGTDKIQYRHNGAWVDLVILPEGNIKSSEVAWVLNNVKIEELKGINRFESDPNLVVNKIYALNQIFGAAKSDQYLKKTKLVINPDESLIGNKDIVYQDSDGDDINPEYLDFEELKSRFRTLIQANPNVGYSSQKLSHISNISIPDSTKVIKVRVLYQYAYDMLAFFTDQPDGPNIYTPTIDGHNPRTPLMIYDLTHNKLLDVGSDFEWEMGVLRFSVQGTTRGFARNNFFPVDIPKDRMYVRELLIEPTDGITDIDNLFSIELRNHKIRVLKSDIVGQLFIRSINFVR